MQNFRYPIPRHFPVQATNNRNIKISLPMMSHQLYTHYCLCSNCLCLLNLLVNLSHGRITTTLKIARRAWLREMGVVRYRMRIVNNWTNILIILASLNIDTWDPGNPLRCPGSSEPGCPFDFFEFWKRVKKIWKKLCGNIFMHSILV